MPRLCVTPGEPAGIGPELMLPLSDWEFPAEVVAIGSRELIAARLAALGCHPRLLPFDPQARAPKRRGELTVADVPLCCPSTPGVLDRRNGDYVLRCLDLASDGCLGGTFDALVTGPVSKAAIDGEGRRFTGHTEYLRDRAGVERVVMLLGCEKMRVALATTHLPLREVPDAITEELLLGVLSIIDHDFRTRWGIAHPRIICAGLNPHAGEDGHLGREELDTIIPALRAARERGIGVEGPLPADTIFQDKCLSGCDAVLTMYHDQGLPTLKYAGFDQGYNTTLGLPYVRTSVDHGTALDLAGTGRADPGSLRAALGLALKLAKGQGGHAA
ncbi:MAG: 4-hydroxythreonine-4-phosphate dehydrogenase PdxA [Succinivibrionaceae bacterium]|nr:4-hydroxythreonine-4-phosphate dehydrogenase PdxA [Succinivibrionaceae bacterium]